MREAQSISQQNRGGPPPAPPMAVQNNNNNNNNQQNINRMVPPQPPPHVIQQNKATSPGDEYINQTNKRAYPMGNINKNLQVAPEQRTRISTFSGNSQRIEPRSGNRRPQQQPFQTGSVPLP
eukprot:UN03046